VTMRSMSVWGRNGINEPMGMSTARGLVGIIYIYFFRCVCEREILGVEMEYSSL
jgi:hypothetical protein